VSIVGDLRLGEWPSRQAVLRKVHYVMPRGADDSKR